MVGFKSVEMVMYIDLNKVMDTKGKIHIEGGKSINRL